MKNMLKKFIFFLLIIFVASCAKKEDAYLKDLEFIYKEILENHPGVYNNQDLNFSKNLEEFFHEARLKLKKAENKDSIKKSILKNFCKSFNDSHLWIYWLEDIYKKKALLLKYFL